MSFVSLFELGELLIEFFYIACEKKRKNDEKKKSQQNPIDLECFLKDLNNNDQQDDDINVWRKKISFTLSELHKQIKQIEMEKSSQTESARKSSTTETD